MRILHTADWHLGRIFHAVHLTDDQAYLMDQFVGIAREYSPDTIIISGDIYDRAVPPPEAVKLLDETLYRLMTDIKIPVMIIAGNHDSPDRLSFGSRLLSSQGLHIAGLLTSDITKCTLNDNFGPVHFYLLPYAEPSIVREYTNSICTDHNSSMQILTDKIREIHVQGDRSVLCAHAFVAGGTISDSERPVSIGGTGTVDLSCFDNFSFVALGHLHRNQWPASHIHYPGSPMKYSFSEVDHKKSVSIIDIDEDGSVKSQVIPLTPRRDVRSVKGTLEQILMNGHLDSNPDDYINVILSDREPQLDIISKLRDVYPNVLNIERPDFSAQIDENKIDHRTLGDLELFTAFYNQVTGKNIDDQQLALFSTLMENLHSKNRESC